MIEEFREAEEKDFKKKVEEGYRLLWFSENWGERGFIFDFVLKIKNNLEKERNRLRERGIEQRIYFLSFLLEKIVASKIVLKN